MANNLHPNKDGSSDIYFLAQFVGLKHKLQLKNAVFCVLYHIRFFLYCIFSLQNYALVISFGCFTKVGIGNI